MPIQGAVEPRQSRGTQKMRVAVWGPIAFSVSSSATSSGAPGPRELSARDFPGIKPKQLLEILVMERGHSVSKSRLADLLWPSQLPRNYMATLETYVSVLRQALEPGVRARDSVIRTEHGGYRLDAGRPGQHRPRRVRRPRPLRGRPSRAGQRRWRRCAGPSRLIRGAGASRTSPTPTGPSRSARTYQLRHVQALIDAGRLALLTGEPTAALAYARGGGRAQPAGRVGLPGAHDRGLLAVAAGGGAAGLRAVPPAAGRGARRRPDGRDRRPAPGDPAARGRGRAAAAAAASARSRAAAPPARRAGTATSGWPAARARAASSPGSRTALDRRWPGTLALLLVVGDAGHGQDPRWSTRFVERLGVPRGQQPLLRPRGRAALRRPGPRAAAAAGPRQRRPHAACSTTCCARADEAQPFDRFARAAGDGGPRRRRSAARQPLVLVLDDAQWADDETIRDAQLPAAAQRRGAGRWWS